MQCYEKNLTVAGHDLDDLDHVNNVRFVQWIQDISKEHWQQCAPVEMQLGVVWVVLSHHIAYKNSAKLGDSILVRTRITESKGATCVREVEMFNSQNNVLLVRSMTEWCLLNKNTLRPMRISENIKQVFT